MILIGLGANLPSKDHGAPRNTLEAALRDMAARDIHVTDRSRWYRCAPVPPVDDDGAPNPWYVNGVAAVETGLDPSRLMAVLHDIERTIGRVRRRRWAPRVVDLDLLAYNTRVTGAHWSRRPERNSDPAAGPADFTLPHPRLHQRSFVLLPLRDIAPNWIHPALGLPLDSLIEALDRPTEVQALER